MQQVVWKLDIGLVNLVNQQYTALFTAKRFPQFTRLDVVFNIINPVIPQLAIT